MATVTLRPFGQYAGTTVDTVALIALLVCLIPTTIGGLLSAIGIAGMDRVARFNVLAMSGRAVEASGDVDVILLDKTGTITYGNRLAASITAAPGVTETEALDAALVASIRDETPEGRSIVELVRKRLAELGRAGRRRRRRRLRGPRHDHRRRDPVPRRDPHERCQDDVRDDHPEGSGRRDRDEGRRPAGQVMAEADRIADLGRHAARPRERGPGPRRDRAQGHGQGRASSSGSPSSAGWASGR